ncbi:TfoX/Sxy family protein [[Eubacterium] siraeum]|nr:TfoX/Sxy family protein [[Eubacterium] siraeum]
MHSAWLLGGAYAGGAVCNKIFCKEKRRQRLRNGNIEFVCEQLVGIENVRYKKMFGEYMVYVNDKPVLLVCDNTVYVKKLPEIEELMSGTECGVPYDGAKEHYILDIEDRELTAKAVEILERITPVPKKRSKKK